MKSYIRITALTAVIFLAGIILFAALTSGTVTQDTSRKTITALNDIARIAEALRSELGTPSKLFDNQTCTDFVILDMTDHVLYSNTILEEQLSVEKAIQKRYPIIGHGRRRDGKAAALRTLPEMGIGFPGIGRVLRRKIRILQKQL